MATPPYKGAGQPQADDGSWSGLGSWFGGGTPAYKPAPAAKANVNANADTSASAIAQTIDLSSLPPGPVVVLVPRGVAAQCDATDPQDDEQQQ